MLFMQQVESFFYLSLAFLWICSHFIRNRVDLRSERSLVGERIESCLTSWKLWSWWIWFELRIVSYDDLFILLLWLLLSLFVELIELEESVFYWRLFLLKNFVTGIVSMMVQRGILRNRKLWVSLDVEGFLSIHCEHVLN